MIQALKVQEKLLTRGLVQYLDARGIDTSDLEQSIVAFINQGVINSGEIRGSVSSKIGSIVFRRKGKERSRRGLTPPPQRA